MRKGKATEGLVQQCISISGVEVYIIEIFANCSYLTFTKSSYHNPRQQKYPTVICYATETLAKFEAQEVFEKD